MAGLTSIKKPRSHRESRGIAARGVIRTLLFIPKGAPQELAAAEPALEGVH